MRHYCGLDIVYKAYKIKKLLLSNGVVVLFMISVCYENQTVLISICYTNCIVYWSKRSPACNVSPVCVVVALHLSTDIKGLVNNLKI